MIHKTCARQTFVVRTQIIRLSHTYHHARPAHKNEEFWSVRCDLLGVRQNSLMLMLKNVSVFPRVNVDARRTSDQRKSNVRQK